MPKIKTMCTTEPGAGVACFFFLFPFNSHSFGLVCSLIRST
jgi:hypothetical protein